MAYVIHVALPGDPDPEGVAEVLRALVRANARWLLARKRQGLEVPSSSSEAYDPTPRSWITGPDGPRTPPDGDPPGGMSCGSLAAYVAAEHAVELVGQGYPLELALGCADVRVTMRGPCLHAEPVCSGKVGSSWANG